MNILFLHQNFPGRYGHLAREFARDPAPGTHQYVAGFERGVLYGQASRGSP